MLYDFLLDLCGIFYIDLNNYNVYSLDDLEWELEDLQNSNFNKYKNMTIDDYINELGLEKGNKINVELYKDKIINQNNIVFASVKRKRLKSIYMGEKS